MKYVYKTSTEGSGAGNKLCDKVETVGEFAYLADKLSAGERVLNIRRASAQYQESECSISGERVLNIRRVSAQYQESECSISGEY